jgi:hypothetical protein
MNERTLNAPHLDDGDLIRYLDHAVEGAERRDAVRHLSGCEACAERLAEFGEQSERAAEYLGALDVNARADELTRARALSAARRARPARRGGGSVRALRAAAVAAVVAVGALTVQPVRAWLVERFAELTGASASVAVQPIDGNVGWSGGRVAFDPVGDVFVLEIAHAQPLGAVRLEMADSRQATAQIVNGEGETLLVLPSGVRVENTAGSTADYHVTLPSNLRLVQVFAGGAPMAIIEVVEGDTGLSRTVPLQRNR